MPTLESDGHGKVAEHPRLVGEKCSGCDGVFQINDGFESLYDRVYGTAYLIHPNCWAQLVEKLERSNSGRSFPWER